MSEPVKIGIITKREYEWLSSMNSLEPHELVKIKEYENQIKTNASAVKTQDKQKKEIEKKEGVVVSKLSVWNLFVNQFEKINGKKFELNQDTKLNVEPVIKYFAKDESFKDCLNLVTSFNGSRLTPSFDKGLLIVGDYGNGKTSIMTALCKGFNDIYLTAYYEHWQTFPQWKELRFKHYNSHDVVTEFEGLDSPESRTNFMQKYSTFRLYFDDVKKERIASNYGKTDILREILEKRYDKKAKTFITCNYKEGHPNNLEVALSEFGERYGGHVFDRLFEMFNIIEFKGKSFRK